MKQENENTNIKENGSTRASTPTEKLKNTSVGADSISAKNGITLIALVITIIIMLILAGIVLTLTIGENGLINKSILAKNKYDNSYEEEQNQLAQLEKEMIENTREGSKSYKIEKIGEATGTTPIEFDANKYDTIYIRIKINNDAYATEYIPTNVLGDVPEYYCIVQGWSVARYALIDISKTSVAMNTIRQSNSNVINQSILELYGINY